MRLVVDVYDANGNRIGQPLRNCRRFSLSRRLDGAGDISLSFPSSDKRVAEYLTYKSRVKVWLDDGSSTREVGSGIINDDDFSESSSGASLTFKGVDLLEELKHRNTLSNLRYDKQALNAVVSDLIALVPGWSVTASIVNPITARFDGTSILKALQTVTSKLSNNHLRLSGWQQVEVGTFGDDIGLRIFKPERITTTMRKKTNLAFIKSIKITGRSKDIANRIYVYGAGQSLDTALTLKYATSTRSIALGYAYDIGSIVRNNRSHYYIEDAAAISKYGLIEKFGQYKEIAPLSAAEVDVTAASEALYDAAAADLARRIEAQIVYSVSLTNLKMTVLPGDKVRLVYEDPIVRTNEAGGGVQANRSIDALFSVLSVRESFDGKHSVELEISNIDQHPKTLAQKLFTSIEELKVYANQIQPSVTAYPYSESIQIDAAGSAAEQKGIVQFPVQNFAYEVDRVQMRVRSEVFESTAKGAAGGGEHYHRVFKSAGTWINPIDGYTGRVMNALKSDLTSQFSIIMVNASDDDLYTEGGSGDHTHDPIYGVYRDTLYPGLMTIKVNGTVIAATDVTPVADMNNAYDATFDITPEILGKAGGFRGVHNIEISCAEGRGRVLVNFDASIYMLPYQYA
jgi:hypothetical protein